MEKIELQNVIREKFEMRKELIMGIFNDDELYYELFDQNYDTRLFNFLKRYSPELTEIDERLDIMNTETEFIIIASGYDKYNDYIQFHLYTNKDGYVYKINKEVT